MRRCTGKRAARLISMLLLLVVVAALSACGGSTDSGASELARQRELAEAQRQAAQDARQSAHIKELEHRLRSMARKNRNGGTAEASPTPPHTASHSPGEQERSSGLGDWPGGSGFTAILASLPTEAEAASTQSEATARGLDAGLLFSSDFNSLRPGYWVVFSGVFRDASGAAARATRAHELGYTDAYPRFVSP